MLILPLLLFVTPTERVTSLDSCGSVGINAIQHGVLVSESGLLLLQDTLTCSADSNVPGSSPNVLVFTQFEDVRICGSASIRRDAPVYVRRPGQNLELFQASGTVERTANDFTAIVSLVWSTGGRVVGIRVPVSIIE